MKNLVHIAVIGMLIALVYGASLLAAAGSALLVVMVAALVCHAFQSVDPEYDHGTECGCPSCGQEVSRG